jgi:hypothetical protein
MRRHFLRSLVKRRPREKAARNPSRSSFFVFLVGRCNRVSIPWRIHSGLRDGWGCRFSKEVYQPRWET